MIEYKSFRLKVKELSEAEGTFGGQLSVYNNVDQGMDVIRPGAFTKSLAERNNVVPLLWQHDTDLPIGVHQLSDNPPSSLDTNATLNLDKQLGREALSDLKMWQRFGMQFGLSIGYETVKENPLSNGIRELLEVKLWEGSLVTFPMNPLAQVSSVKRLAKLQREIHEELKEGRTISRATRERLTRIMDELSALLPDLSDEGDGKAATTQDEPADESLIAQLKELNSLFEVKA